MNFKLPLIAAFVGALSLSACGGGSNSSTPTTSVSSPASLVINDITVGTGATVTASSSVTINYTISLYKADAANFTGTQIETGPYSFTVGVNTIAGVSAGIVGMKVGGRRVLLIPASQAYGSAGSGAIPPNSGVVFDMTLVSAK
ncbi:FKBP-type peptidyl-prolyl cis-trans isomerase [Massilia sp. PWRC2]|uniref:FKBP-type peptidyl-prolyl cis-trans isomerase n=1 Tax=Massilia sp. PWRC2 TaxID=2804626 RepID=UPI003CF5DAB3